jgi:hypothetical protein
VIIMERKVCCFTLCADRAQGAADYLKQRLNCEPDNYGDASAFVAEAVAYASQGGFAFVAAPVDIFLNVKFRLLKSLSLKIVRSKECGGGKLALEGSVLEVRDRKCKRSRRRIPPLMTILS